MAQGKHLLHRCISAVAVLSMVIGVFLPMTVAAKEGFEYSGFVGAETRVFTENPQFPGQSEGPQNSLVLRPEFRWQWKDQRVTFIPFYRLDSMDDERTHGDIRELNWRKIGSNWEILAGIGHVFWGVTESRHLVDIINQTDLVENIDLEEKLGQPMVNVTTFHDWGTMNFFVLPGFRERTFPGVEGRLRTPFPIDTDNPLYESSAEDKHVDFAARYSHVIGDWDLGAYYFYGTGREPRLILDAPNQRFIPFYDLINQVGTDIQYTYEAWLLKFEGIVREGQGKTFGAVVAGFEYTFYQVSNSAIDVGLLLEYLYDGRDETAPPTLFDDDIFVGTRIAFNDVADTTILAGAVFDTGENEKFYALEAERRFGDSFTGELEIRIFGDAPFGTLLNAFSKDDYIQLGVNYYF